MDQMARTYRAMIKLLKEQLLMVSSGEFCVCFQEFTSCFDVVYFQEGRDKQFLMQQLHAAGGAPKKKVPDAKKTAEPKKTQKDDSMDIDTINA